MTESGVLSSVKYGGNARASLWLPTEKPRARCGSVYVHVYMCMPELGTRNSVIAGRTGTRLNIGRPQVRWVNGVGIAKHVLEGRQQSIRGNNALSISVRIGLFDCEFYEQEQDKGLRGVSCWGHVPSILAPKGRNLCVTRLAQG